MVDPTVTEPAAGSDAFSAVIVVPCYNEAERLDVDAFSSWVQAHEDVGFLFVNDGSRDDTLKVLEALRLQCPQRIAVFDQQPNQGKGEAVRQGMLAALDHTAWTEEGPSEPPHFVGYFDADLATPLEALDEFIAVLETRDDIEIVLGSRVALLGRAIERKPVRHVLGRVFATFASLVLGLAVYDTQCGAKLFRRNETTRGLFAESFGSRWIFDVEILARYLTGAGHAGGLYELPLMRWEDVGDSKVKGSDFVRAVAEMAVIFRRYRVGQAWQSLLLFITTPFFRYAIAGAVGTAMHYLTLVAAVELVGTTAPVGTTVGAIVGACVNYVLNYHFTFASDQAHRETLPRFMSVALLSAALNGAGMWLAVDLLSVHYIVAQVACTLGVLFLGYLLNKAWTFRSSRVVETRKSSGGPEPG